MPRTIRSQDPAMPAKKADAGTIKGGHVLAGILVFFGVIFAVNGVFLYAALDTHTGLVSKQPYRRGLDYNDRIAADERQKIRGWTHRVQLDLAKTKLRLDLADKHGRPVSGLRIKGFVGRPSTVQHDLPVHLAETEPGTYTANLTRLSGGNWLVQLDASELKPAGPETVYRLKERVWLKR